MPIIFKNLEYGRSVEGGRLAATLSFEGTINEVPLDLEIRLSWPDQSEATSVCVEDEQGRAASRLDGVGLCA